MLVLLRRFVNFRCISLQLSIEAESIGFDSGNSERSITRMTNLSSKSEEYLAKVEKELGRYEHPLFQWTAVSVENGIDVLVNLKQKGLHDDAYKFHLAPRELEARAFEWDFQRQLYNYLHDYLI